MRYRRECSELNDHMRNGAIEHAWERVFAMLAGSPDHLVSRFRSNLITNKDTL